MYIKPKYDRNNTPPEIQLSLQDYIVEYNLYRDDNYRYSPKDDPEGMEIYERIAQAGCCGREDFLAWDNSGREWVVGCNYGH